MLGQIGSGGNSSSSINRPTNAGPFGGAMSMNATVANFTDNGGLVGKGGANKDIVKQVHRSLMQGKLAPTNNNMNSLDSA